MTTGHILAVRLVRLLHANGWKYSFEHWESRDWQGAPDKDWATHTWTRDGQEIQAFTDFGVFDAINWRPDDGDSFVSTDRRMLAKLGYEATVGLLVAVGAVHAVRSTEETPMGLEPVLPEEFDATVEDRHEHGFTLSARDARAYVALSLSARQPRR